VTVLFSVLALSSKQRKADPAWIRYVLVAAFVLLAVLKGTSPGGPRARADFEAASAADL
jgi:hypothetical protein